MHCWMLMSSSRLWRTWEPAIWSRHLTCLRSPLRCISFTSYLWGEGWMPTTYPRWMMSLSFRSTWWWVASRSWCASWGTSLSVETSHGTWVDQTKNPNNIVERDAELICWVCTEFRCILSTIVSPSFFWNMHACHASREPSLKDPEFGELLAHFGELEPLLHPSVQFDESGSGPTKAIQSNPITIHFNAL